MYLLTNNKQAKKMTITEATFKIKEKFEAGLISQEESQWFNRMVRRTGDYGNKWSWKRQADMRANLLKDF